MEHVPWVLFLSAVYTSPWFGSRTLAHAALNAACGPFSGVKLLQWNVKLIEMGLHNAHIRLYAHAAFNAASFVGIKSIKMLPYSKNYE
ncbi:MAG: hypothetical protein LBD44_06185 [Spirochaetaceae bacterium]|jgi:hypothetical protein|nr:hypothetical protein [Spirochaetaceae bacterium]